MKKFLLAGLVLMSSSAFASEAVLVCRQSGFMDYKTSTPFSLQCGSSSTYECENNLRQQLESQYGSLTRACESALGGAWYSDRIKIKY